MDAIDQGLIALLQKGMPLVARPYHVVAEKLHISEVEVLNRLQQLKQQGLISRQGVVVNHRKMGYRANAMVVFDIPDHRVEELGHRIGQITFVNLCYQRPRQGEVWPYNLYCMIHGKSRDTVLKQLDRLVELCDLSTFRRDILFSRQCFKQRGARYELTENPVIAHG
jgi:DNA-binding Lrp family transcriptional regulator